MNGFTNIVNGFSQAAIDALVTQADSIYLNGDTWVETPLPTVAFDVTDYGISGDGVIDNSSAMDTLAGNTGVTNWYFPAGDYRMYQVNIPSHVVAVYGEGTIVSISTGSTGYQYGGLYVNSPHQDLVIDGLSFKGESGYNGNQYYGQLQLNSNDSGNDTDNTQIRNCHFDASLRVANSLRIFGRTDATGSDHTNCRVYNNTFINSRYFAIEAFNNGTDVSDNMTGLNGLRIYNNDISGTSGWGVGIGRIRGESYIYNNDIDVNGFGTEIIQCNNNHTYSNRVGATDGHTLSQGVIDIDGPLMALGVNYIHNNHYYGQKADVYHGSLSDIYENYFGCWVELRGSTSTAQKSCGNFHDNTVVTPSSVAAPLQAIGVEGSTTENIISNNEVYGQTTYTDTYCIYNTDGVPTQILVSDNDCYQVTSPNGCVEAGFTEVGGTCTVPYSGAIPTERAGAGLSDPGNVGRP